MALTRRSFIMGVPALAGAAVGCSAAPGERSGAGIDAVLFSSHSSKPGSKSILVCMPETRQTSEVWRGLSDELAQEFELTAMRTEGDNVAATIARGIDRYRPAGLVRRRGGTAIGGGPDLRRLAGADRLRRCRRLSR